jgi:hypothetical protein
MYEKKMRDSTSGVDTEMGEWNCCIELVNLKPPLRKNTIFSERSRVDQFIFQYIIKNQLLNKVVLNFNILSFARKPSKI